jgi:VWFA-related protein
MLLPLFGAAWLLLGASLAPAAGPLDEEGHLSRESASPKNGVNPKNGASWSRSGTSALLERTVPNRALKAAPGRFTAKVSVGMVVVPAVVLDRKGRPVPNLRPDDFTLEEDGETQRIESFSQDLEAPLRIAFLLDVSGSMRTGGRFEDAKDAIRRFLGDLRGGDQAALIAFADRQVAVLAGFSSDPREALRYLEAVRAYGQTALHDAVAATPELVEEGPRQRSAIILLTDGVDNFSALSLDQALTAALLADVPIYCLGLSGAVLEPDPVPAEPGSADRALQLIAAESGGAFYRVRDPEALEAAIQEIARDLRSRYVLAYSPSRPPPAGGFRRIAVRTDRSDWRVRARKGYFAKP